MKSLSNNFFKALIHPLDINEMFDQGGGFESGSAFSNSNELALLLEQQSQKLKTHPVFDSVRTKEDLRCFMSWHAFAVWNFMSLAKRLQHELKSAHLPWTPPKSSPVARMLKDIVLGEESDVKMWGWHNSHIDLYLSAMKEVGANTSQMEKFLGLISLKIEVNSALRMVKAPEAVQKFVQATNATVKNGSVTEVLGGFLYAREEAIPQVFQARLTEWSDPIEKAPNFNYYLKRHIALLGDCEGPVALELVNDLTRGSEDSLQKIQHASVMAIDHRLVLWNALQSELDQRE
jgi:hypothetical protein